MNNSSSAHEDYVPSIMSFVGLESSSQKQLWDWETNTLPPNNSSLTTIITNTATTTTTAGNHPFLTSTPFLDYPSSLLPSNNFPFYSPVPQYQTGLIAMGDEDHSAGHIGLNLGHRTYFSSGDAAAIDRLFKRTRGLYQVSHQIPRCQAEGCKADLSGAKHYHRRHKVCEYHSKATVVLAGGMPQRFCQQCSRFHILSEFDEAKRSCRRRLADHNRRRRKPQPQKSTKSSASKSPTRIPAGKSITQTPPEITRDISIRGTCTTNTSSVTSPCNISLVSQKDYQTKGTHLRNGPALSLGGVGEAEKGGFSSSHTSFHHQHQRAFVVMPDDEKGSQQQHLSSSTSTSFFHPHNFFCSSTNEASQPTTGEPADQRNHHQSNLLHLGQSMFEVDFM